MYKQFQTRARLQALENRSKHHQDRQPPSSTSSDVAIAQSTPNASSDNDAQEFAGNASLALSDSPFAQSSLSLCWCADTGATSHMTPHRDWFEEYEPHTVAVRVADGTVVQSSGIGSVRFRPLIGGSPARVVVFHRVLHVPALQNNLLSVLYLSSKQGFRIVIDKLLMRFERDGQLLFTATQKGKLAYLDGTTVRNSGHSALVSSPPSSLPQFVA